MAKKDEDTADTRLARLILALRSQGVSDPAVLNAIETTPRESFTPDLFKERAFEDSALPIACGQTISQPFIVGLMTQALKVEARFRVLEVGTGSGYQAAVLSRLVRYVYTIERYRTLLSEAEARLAPPGEHQEALPQMGGPGQEGREVGVLRRRREDEQGRAAQLFQPGRERVETARHFVSLVVSLKTRLTGCVR